MKHHIVDNPTAAGFDKGAEFAIDPAVHPKTLVPGVRFEGFGQVIIMNPESAQVVALQLLDAAVTANEKAAMVRAMQSNGIKAEVGLHIVDQAVDIRRDIERVLEEGAKRPDDGPAVGPSMDSFDNEEKFTQLADQLEAEDETKYHTVIKRLRNNWYHDFKNPDEVPMPKMQMIQDFTELGREDIVNRVKEGDFDQ